MKDKRLIELESTQYELEKLKVEGCVLAGDALLNLATERAGYDVGMTCVEQCANCGQLYHTDYGGEYVDPFDHSDLQAELEISDMQKLYYMHFCDAQCLREKAYTLYGSEE